MSQENSSEVWRDVRTADLQIIYVNLSACGDFSFTITFASGWILCQNWQLVRMNDFWGTELLHRGFWGLEG